MSTLHKAILRGDADRVRRMLEKEPQRVEEIHEEQTPLLLATTFARTGIVEVLLAHGADVSARDSREATALHNAAIIGDVDSIDMLLSAGAEVDARNEDGETPLIACCAGADRMPVIAMLIDHGADVNARDRHGLTALHVAAGRQGGGNVALLIARGADVSARAPDGWTPLHAACSGYAMSSMETLISHGADVNAVTDEGVRPIHFAVEKVSGRRRRVPKRGSRSYKRGVKDPKPTPPVQILIDAGATVDIWSAAYMGWSERVRQLLDEEPSLINTRDFRGNTLLHAAIVNGNVHVVELLLERGIDPEVAGPDGDSSVACAAFWGHEDIVELLSPRKDGPSDAPPDPDALHWALSMKNRAIAIRLIRQGVDVNVPSSVGRVPLDYAAGCGDVELVELMLECGANVDGAPGSSRPLMGAIRDGHEDMALLLISRGADFTTPDGDVPVPHKAAASDLPRVVRELLDRGLPIDGIDDKGATAAHVAAENAALDVLPILLEAGADLNARDWEGRTPLHHTVFYPDDETVQWLVAHGADINAVDLWGRTPLHHAAEGYHDHSLVVFLKHGADVNARDREGLTPLGYAKRLRKRKFSRILREHGGIE